MGTLFAGSIVLVLVSLSLRSMIHDKKNGKSLHCGGDCKHCGGDCKHCGGHCNCR